MVKHIIKESDLNKAKTWSESVYLDNEFGLVAVEVDNVVADGLLALKATGHVAKPAIPEPLFLWRHFSAQCSGQLHIVMIVVDEVGML